MNRIDLAADVIGRHKYRPIRSLLGRFHASCPCGWMWDADHGTEVAYSEHLAMALEAAGLLGNETPDRALCWCHIITPCAACEAEG